MIVVGEKETQTVQVSVRKRKKGDLGQFELGDFVDQISKEINKKVNN